VENCGRKIGSRCKRIKAAEAASSPCAYIKCPQNMGSDPVRSKLEGYQKDFRLFSFFSCFLVSFQLLSYAFLYPLGGEYFGLNKESMAPCLESALASLLPLRWALFVPLPIEFPLQCGDSNHTLT
jgi:hypothetical protein